MRITAGIHRSRILKAPEGSDIIRPTSDKVRQAIFNMIGSRMDLDGAHVIDLFCGTGALGLEALSRGATSCHFIDSHPKSLALAKDNARSLGLEAEARFTRVEAGKLGPNTEGSKAHLALLDPPYYRDLVPSALSALRRGGWMHDAALYVVETEKQAHPLWPEGFQVDVTRIHGDTAVWILSCDHAAIEQGE